MILLGDPKRENSDTFIWALPQGGSLWDNWYLAARGKGSIVMGVHYLAREGINGNKVDLLVMLPTDEQSDDDVTTAAAHYRIMNTFNGRIYVLRRAPAPSKFEMLYATTQLERGQMESGEDDPAEFVKPNT